MPNCTNCRALLPRHQHHLYLDRDGVCPHCGHKGPEWRAPGDGETLQNNPGGKKPDNYELQRGGWGEWWQDYGFALTIIGLVFLWAISATLLDACHPL